MHFSVLIIHDKEKNEWEQAMSRCAPHTWQKQAPYSLILFEQINTQSVVWTQTSPTTGSSLSRPCNPTAALRSNETELKCEVTTTKSCQFSASTWGVPVCHCPVNGSWRAPGWCWCHCALRCCLACWGSQGWSRCEAHWLSGFLVHLSTLHHRPPSRSSGQTNDGNEQMMAVNKWGLLLSF